MTIRMSVDGRPVTATLDDTEVARDFAALLPLTMTLEDYASTEKIAYLPRKLAADRAPSRSDAATAGEITYYAPWGNLAVFYKDFRYSAGLVRLGRIDSGLETLERAGSLQVTIETVASIRRLS